LNDGGEVVCLALADLALEVIFPKQPPYLIQLMRAAARVDAIQYGERGRAERLLRCQFVADLGERAAILGKPDTVFKREANPLMSRI